MNVFPRCCSSRPRQAVSCCWWVRWLTASPPSSLGSSLRNYPGYSFAGTFKRLEIQSYKRSPQLMNMSSEKRLQFAKVRGIYSLHSNDSKIFVPQCCQLCAGQNPWIKLLQNSFHGEGAPYVAFSVPACIQLSLNRMANTEYIQYK
jgi:hypothetical protein